jgi:hypothetical protein
MALSIAVVLCVSGCGGRLVTAKDLRAATEAQLYYPGSKVLDTSGSDERSGLTGDYPAEVRAELQSDASAEMLYEWYSAHLQRLGWTLGQVETVNRHYRIYTKGDRYIFQVAVDPASPALYSIRYSVVPAPCATTPPTRVAFAKCG